MNEFWKKEVPEMFEENRLHWSLFKLAGKLQIGRYSRYDKCQSITLDRRAITPKMIEILKKFINLCERNGE